MKTLIQIESKVNQLALIIGAACSSELPTYGKTEDYARPHIEVDASGYHYVIVERGEERSRFTTPELDDLLFLVFEDVTFSLASKFELDNRVESKDSRRLVFHRQVELLSMLSESWGKREADAHSMLLDKYPFDDISDLRMQMSVAVGWTKACEKYPLPKKGEIVVS